MKAPSYNSSSVALALALSAGAAGCALTLDATSLGVPASMASRAQQPAVGDTFNIHTRMTYFLWGAIPGQAPNLERTLAGQLGGGRAVQDLRIRVSHGWSDILITVLTVGLVDPVTVRFQGVITGSAP